MRIWDWFKSKLFKENFSIKLKNDEMLSLVYTYLNRKNLRKEMEIVREIPVVAIICFSKTKIRIELFDGSYIIA